MPDSVLKKEKCLILHRNFYRLFKKRQLLSKFSKISKATKFKNSKFGFLGLEKAKSGNPGYGHGKLGLHVWYMRIEIEFYFSVGAKQTLYTRLGYTVQCASIRVALFHSILTAKQFFPDFKIFFSLISIFKT